MGSFKNFLFDTSSNNKTTDVVVIKIDQKRRIESMFLTNIYSLTYISKNIFTHSSKLS